MSAPSDHADTTKRPLPDGWRWVRLGEVCRVIGGSTPSSNVEEYWGGDIVWVTPTDLGLLQDPIITSSERKITKKGYEGSGTELVPVGSVVLSSRAPIGHLGIAGVPLCTNQGCKSFVPSAEVDSFYLFFCLKTSVPQLKALGSGATFAEISKNKLENFPIPLPPSRRAATYRGALARADGGGRTGAPGDRRAVGRHQQTAGGHLEKGV